MSYAMNEQQPVIQAAKHLSRKEEGERIGKKYERK